MDPERLEYIMKIFNVGNAILLCFSGVWALLAFDLDLLLVLASCYVIMFSCLLFFFEVRLEMCNLCFLKNFGFMFNAYGRLLFFIFIGTLAFGLGLPGIIIGSFTFANAAFNVLVICTHPRYFQHLKEKAEKEVGAAVAMGAAQMEARHSAENQNDIERVGDQKSPAPRSNRSAGGGNSDWIEKRDEHSGTSYWVNNTTGEQCWEKPY